MQPPPPFRRLTTIASDLNGTQLHYALAGTKGTAIVLVHGFPESWWVFHKLMPRLAEHHRVVAVDLRGFGDSALAESDHDSATAARDLDALIAHLDVGPVHLVGQDIGGPTTFRVAAARPQLVRSYTAIETGLPGFGLEKLADVTHGGAWHIGVLAAPGIPELLLAGRERAFLSEYAIPSLSATPDAFTDADINELARTYARPPASAAPPAYTGRRSPRPRRCARWRPQARACPCSRSVADRASSRRRHATGRHRRHLRGARRNRPLCRHGGARTPRRRAARLPSHSRRTHRLSPRATPVRGGVAG